MKTTTRILDQAWYDRLMAISTRHNPVFSLLEPPPDHEAGLRQQFEASGYQDNPDLSARHLGASRKATLASSISPIRNI